MSIDTLFEELTQHFGENVRQNEPLAQHTTMRLGGPADLWVAVTSADELAYAVRTIRPYNIPIFMMGGGANLLIQDGGIRGVGIVNRARAINFPKVQNVLGDTVSLVVESGVILPNFARRCAKQGLAGFEWAVGVPGTIGGAVVNNAGAYDSDMARSVVQVELLSPRGERVWKPVDWFDYSYRSSRLKRQNRNEGWIVLQVELALTAGVVEEIEAKLQQFNARRKASQPPGATIGSMFKNPPGDYAGRLIEAVGLKGYQYGQAQISTVHANFFQNLGGATAAEVMHLIKTAQQAVAQKFGITLELEIEVIGEPVKA